MSARARSRRRVVLAATLAATLTLADDAAADTRWPAWPTEIDRITERLFDVKGSAESERLTALLRLHDYATPVITKAMVRAADDPASQIRREALDLCALRGATACIPAAVRAWNTATEIGERMKALKVIALDPSEARATLLFAALADPDEHMRWSAVRLIAFAPFDAKGREAARAKLLSKLTDSAPRVRADAAMGLSVLGGEGASLAIVRLLADPEPSVREAAAVALGRIADPRTRPALVRALRRGGSPGFVHEAIQALAALPGEDVDPVLLELLDEPPEPSLGRRHVAEAIGRRRQPSRRLLEGLIDRLREEPLRADAVHALLRLGDAAVPALEHARAAGLEPALALEVDALLAARALPERARALGAHLPAPDERERWHALLAQRDTSLDPGEPDPGRLDDAALTLARAAPPWLDGAIAGAVARAGRAGDVRPWLIALATTPRGRLDGRDDAWTWMRVAAWAVDAGASAEDRCLALAAVGAAQGTRHRARVLAQVRALSKTASPLVRACLGPTLGRLQDEPTLRALLRDPSPQVRAGAALGCAGLARPSRRLDALLAAQAFADPVEDARGSAAWARAHAGAGPGPAALVRAPHARRGRDEAGWLWLRDADAVTLHVPVVGPGSPALGTEEAPRGPGRRWILAPGLEDARVQEAEIPAPASMLDTH